jgi:hypothetical protein
LGSLGGGSDNGEFGESSALPKLPEMSSNSGRTRMGSLAAPKKKIMREGQAGGSGRSGKNQDTPSSSMRLDLDVQKDEVQEWALELYRGQAESDVDVEEEEGLLAENIATSTPKRFHAQRVWDRVGANSEKHLMLRVACAGSSKKQKTPIKLSVKWAIYDIIKDEMMECVKLDMKE